MQLCDMLYRHYSTDAHFSAYYHNNALRLSKGAPSKLATPPRMRILALDIDAPGKHRTPRWCDEFSRACERLSGLPFAYFTAHGARLIWLIDRSIDDWSAFYLRALLSVRCVSDITADPVCCDWTRLFRAPHATRDGVEQRHGIAFGSVDAIGEWRECVDEFEIRLAAQQLATRGDVWARVERALWPSIRTRVVSTHRANDWRARAIDRAIAAIQTAPKGERNTTLYKRAIRCFELEKIGPINGLEQRLEAVGASIGLNASEVRATIRSARRAVQNSSS